MACIILGISGSIAAYKAADIASALVKAGHEVHCVCTAKALEFVTALTLHTISRNPVFSSFEDEKGDWVPPHIQLAQRADLLVVAPPPAKNMGKFAHGFGTDRLTFPYLGR
ncbi:flavoprotein, partial [uncultured Akkermansia sp.]|uniref:flavoprotein n=1 Tax=uncultured Akkermansia sp. TaxID=512294 RepID=UPI0025DF2EC8